MNLFSRLGAAMKYAATGQLSMSALSGGFEGAMVRIAAVPITALDLPQRAASPAVPALKRVSVPMALKAYWPSCLLQKAFMLRLFP